MRKLDVYNQNGYGSKKRVSGTCPSGTRKGGVQQRFKKNESEMTDFTGQLHYNNIVCV